MVNAYLLPLNSPIFILVGSILNFLNTLKNSTANLNVIDSINKTYTYFVIYPYYGISLNDFNFRFRPP